MADHPLLDSPEAQQIAVEDQDPQSAIASQGFGKLGSMVGQNLKNQYNAAGEQIHQAASGSASDPATREALMNMGQQAAMSTVGKTEAPKIQFLTREAVEAKGLAIPEAHTPSEELGKDVGYNYRLNQTPNDITYAVKDGKVVGHLGIDDNGAVKSVNVDPEHQREGIAQGLYEARLQSGGPFSSDEPTAMEPEAKALWEKLKKTYPSQVTKSKQGFTFNEPKKVKASLPMDEASRLARAEKMGFDTSKTYYHGTPESNIEEFDPYASPRDTSGKIAGFFTKNPKFANEFVNRADSSHIEEFGENPNIIPVHLKTKNTFDYDNASHVDDIMERLSNSDVKEIGKENKVNNKPMGRSQLKQQLGLGNWNFLENPKILQAIQDAGHDSMHVYENGEKNIAVFEPHQVRSKFAEFNPKKSKSGNLSYAQGGQVDSSILDSPEAHAIAGTQAPEQHNLDQGNSYSSLLDSPEAHSIAQDDKYGGLGQQAIAGAEAVGRGLVGPIAPLAERAMGVNPEDIRAREEANPATHLTGEIVGLVAPAIASFGTSLEGRAALEAGTQAISTAAKLSKFTQAGLLNKIGFEGGETLAGRIGAQAAKGAIDNMLIAGSDEASRAILNDPNQSAETIVPTILLSGVLGGGIGGGVGLVGEAWTKATSGKASQIISDFRGRLQDHVNNPEPVKAIQSELEQLYGEVKDEPIWGKTGVKAEAIEKHMPELSEKMINHANDLVEKSQDALRRLEGDPSQRLLLKEVNDYHNAVNASDSSVDLFNAAQNFKKNLQTLANYEKIPTLAQKAFIDEVKPLAASIRQSLEDTGVWGQAGKVQKEINSNFASFQKTIKNFQQTFMGDLNGTKVFDPNKLQTYINQADKGKAGLKTSKLGNFLEEAQSYKSAIEDLYSKIGMESPFEPTSIQATMNTLKEKTTGAKLADAFIQKGLTDAGGKAVGAGAGAMLGSLVGHGPLGAIIGGHALGPFFSSVLPAITKSIVESPVSGAGFKAATDYSVQVAKGLKLMNNATQAVFKAGSQVIPSNLYPSRDDRVKLEKSLERYQQNPQAMITDRDRSKLGHYLPNHESALNQTAATAISYLNSLKPQQSRENPLDTPTIPSSTQKGAYNSALDLINQPLMILDKIKDGTVTSADLQAVGTVYPALYNSLKSKLTDEMINAVHNEQAIPYKTKVAMSMFLAQPLDSTMKPTSIMAAQPKDQQNQQLPPSKPMKGVKSSPALQKMPDMAKTPGQAREQRQQLRH